MISSLVPALISAFKARRELALENVALRQQLAVLRRSVKRPRLSKVDRVFWVLLRRIWTDWEASCPKTQTNSRLARRPVASPRSGACRRRCRRFGFPVRAGKTPSSNGMSRSRAETWVQARAAPGPERASRLRRGSPGLDSGNLGRPLFRRCTALSAARSPLWRKRGTRKSRLETNTENAACSALLARLW